MNCLLVVALLLSATSVVAGDWSQWRGPNRDGKAVGESIRTDWDANPPKLLWKTEGIGTGYGSVAIVGDRLYTMGYSNQGQTVFAINLNSHEIVWSAVIAPKGDIGYPGSRSTPTVVDDRLYVVGSTGVLSCLNTSDGEVLWKKDFALEFDSQPQRWGYAESPLVDGDLVIATPGAADAMLAAFDRTTGRIVWTTPYPDLDGNGKAQAGYSSAVISEGGGVRQYVQNTGKGVVGVRAEDGKFLWANTAAANRVAVIPTPLIKDDLVFASSSYKQGSVGLRLISDGDGGVEAEQLYFLDGRRIFENHHGQMILHEGYVYGGHGQNSGFPMCIELETGEVMWGGRQSKLRGPKGASKSAAVLFVDGHIIWRYQNGVVAVTEASPEEYRLKGTFTPEFVESPSWAHPVVVDGKLYLRENDMLMVYDISS
ncbi:PQQ-binding-like beta-propeller repeat protein [Stratiformator vulcanicus]|uniref:PQQ-binding-like beta-propeller repeat protein n=1 Tax=Stratiformator vulcanicus TaxID=2527980 RepID=UPI0028772CB5|nr:PQQ-binding-like beta-propeller repeat protein [Stratiformator vulcanicus]